MLVLHGLCRLLWNFSFRFVWINMWSHWGSYNVSYCIFVGIIHNKLQILEWYLYSSFSPTIITLLAHSDMCIFLGENRYHQKIKPTVIVGKLWSVMCYGIIVDENSVSCRISLWLLACRNIHQKIYEGWKWNILKRASLRDEMSFLRWKTMVCSEPLVSHLLIV